MQTAQPGMHMKIAVFALLATCVPLLSNASTASLLPTSAIFDLSAGDIVTFDVFIDFSADGGTLGGGLDVVWDSSALGFVDLTSGNLGDPVFGRDPDIQAGLLNSWGVGDFNGIDSGLLGSVSFEVLSSMGLGVTTIVELGPTAGIAGPWVSAVDFISILDPEYNQYEVSTASVIPVPAAIWLFGTGLAGLIGFSMRLHVKAES